MAYLFLFGSEEIDTVKLGDIVEFSQGIQVGSDSQIHEIKDGYIRFLRIENYTQQSNDFRYIPVKLSKNKVVDKDDIVIVRYGASAGFAGRGLDGILANNLFKITIKNKDLINQDYLYYLLSH